MSLISCLVLLASALFVPVSGDLNHALCNIADGFTYVPDFLYGWKCPGYIPDVDEVCTWSGVTCGTDNKIISLQLGNLGIQGTLSPWIGTLFTLRTLNLWGNNLQGTLPIELGGLKHLKTLSLFGNSFTDAIPDRVCNQARVTGFYPCFPSADGDIVDVCGGLTSAPDCLPRLKNLTESNTWVGQLPIASR